MGSRRWRGAGVAVSPLLAALLGAITGGIVALAGAALWLQATGEGEVLGNEHGAGADAAGAAGSHSRRHSRTHKQHHQQRQQQQQQQHHHRQRKTQQERQQQQGAGSVQQPEHDLLPHQPALATTNSVSATQAQRRKKEEEEGGVQQQAASGVRYRTVELTDRGRLIDDSVRRRTLNTSSHFGFHSMHRKVVVVLVGLPARGKSFIANKLCRYFDFQGYACRIFNVGEVRRKMGYGGVDSSFFDRSNTKANKLREQFALQCQHDMLQWLTETQGVAVAIFDATNISVKRRQLLRTACRRREGDGVSILFVESICNDEEILRINYAAKMQNEDYRGKDEAVARTDFARRVAQYRSVYQSLSDTEDDGNVAYIQVYDVGRKVVARRCSGYLPSHVCFYLQNIHMRPRKIWLLLPAETENQNSRSVHHGHHSTGLTQEGETFSRAVFSYAQAQDSAAVILAGTSKECRRTVALRGARKCDIVHTGQLNELRAGQFTGMPLAQLETDHPKLYREREADKLQWRYPGGESYMDVLQRLRPLLVELERQERSMVLVGHLATVRCVYGYFMSVDKHDIPYLAFPTHTVLELHLGSWGCRARHVNLAMPSESRDNITLPVVRPTASTDEAAREFAGHAALPRWERVDSAGSATTAAAAAAAAAAAGTAASASPRSTRALS